MSVNVACVRMYAVKYVLCWIVMLCCWQETQAKETISMLKRTRVALAGDTLNFNLSVVFSANCSSSLICYTQNKNIWSKKFTSDSSDKTRQVTAHIKMHNSSSSGSYYFHYTEETCGKNLKVHWVVHVRDKGYQEPADELESDIITMMTFSGILLIFSLAGSLYILKIYKYQPPHRDDSNVVAEQRPEQSDDVMLEEDAASASLYTTLQHRSASIYDSLHPEIMMHEENTRKKNSDKKFLEAQEDEVPDSIYENL